MNLLSKLFEHLKVLFPGDNGERFGYEATGNILPDDWLLQTPNIWGKRITEIPVQELRPPGTPGIDKDFRLPECTGTTPGCLCKEIKATVALPGGAAKKLCVGHSTGFVDEFYLAMIQAEKTVYISTLGGSEGPGENFLAALRNAITYLGHTKKKIDIFFLVGAEELLPGNVARNLVNELVRDLKQIPGAQVNLVVLVSGGVSWNHSKIIVVDQHFSITGGHNMYQEAYLGKNPVSDLSMKLSGPVSVHAHRYFWKAFQHAQRAVNWHYVAGYPEVNDLFQANALIEPAPVHSIPATAGHTGAGAGLTVPVLAVGRLSGGWDTEPSDKAILYLLEQAQESIKIVQQNIGWGPEWIGFEQSWPWLFLKAIAGFMIKKKKPVYIVQTDPNAEGYNTGATLSGLYNALIKAAAMLENPPDEKEVRQIFSRQLKFAPIRFSEDQEWAPKKGIANHAKFIMIDDETFYIGSHNMYPTGPVGIPFGYLFEFGYIVESKPAAAKLLNDYWNKIWQYSYSNKAVHTGKAVYYYNEVVDIYVNVPDAVDGDSVEFYDEKKPGEVWWTWTEGIKNGRIMRNEYRVEGSYLAPPSAGQKITIKYFRDPKGSGRKEIGSTSFEIRPMEVVLTPEKKSYQVGEKVRVKIVVKNVKPDGDTITLNRKDGSEITYFETKGVTNGFIAAEWTIPEKEIGETITINYLYNGIGGLAPKKWKITAAVVEIRKHEAIIYPGKEDYQVHEPIDLYIKEVHGRIAWDTFEMFDEAGKKLFWGRTGDIREGRITRDEMIPRENGVIPKFQKIAVKYMYDGTSEARKKQIGETLFYIKHMVVKMTAKPVYTVDEEIIIEIEVSGARPYIDSLEFYRDDNDTGRPNDYFYTNDITSGPVKTLKPWWYKGHEVMVRYVYNAGVGAQNYDVTGIKFRVV